MSRNKRRFPVIRQERIDKRAHNRLVRRHMPDYPMHGGMYKKLVKGFWEWHYRYTLREAVIDRRQKHGISVTEDEMRNEWEKWCIRK